MAPAPFTTVGVGGFRADPLAIAGLTVTPISSRHRASTNGLRDHADLIADHPSSVQSLGSIMEVLSRRDIRAHTVIREKFARRVDFGEPCSSQYASEGAPPVNAWKPSSRATIRLVTREGDTPMRFMMFMLPNLESDADWLALSGVHDAPTAEAVAKMGKYNDALTKAGVLLSAEGLHPQTEGTRVTFSGGKGTVTDGPFTEAKEMIGGYWLIRVESKEEAIEWAKRVPTVGGDFTIEVRQVFDMEDFPPDAQAAAGGTA
jgi:hypothetical protein